MTNYSNFEVEDFLHDDFFVDWVLKQDTEHELFWTQWLAKNPEKQKIVEQSRSIILSVKVNPIPAELSDAELNAIIANLQQRLKEQQVHHTIQSKFYHRGWFKIAAAILVFFSIGVYVLKFGKTYNHQLASKYAAEQFLTVVNHTSLSKLVRMSDGSLAVLKPGSGLKYTKSFKHKREVFLEGEAFFEVHKNHRIPFLVHSNEMIVKVLGTSFTVKKLNDNHDIKVVVNTGKVLVYNKNAVDKANSRAYQVVLTPNQQVTYAAKQLQFKKETLAIPLILSKEIAQKAFTFEDASFSEVIEKIEKAYGVYVEYDHNKLGNINLTASLSDKPLDEKIKLICKAINASCQFIDGRIVILSPAMNQL